jgi:hypothetical protein
MLRTYEHMLQDIAEEKVRPRPGRRNRRCVKRRVNPFPGPPKTGSRALPRCIRLEIVK